MMMMTVETCEQDDASQSWQPAMLEPIIQLSWLISHPSWRAIAMLVDLWEPRWPQSDAARRQWWSPAAYSSPSESRETHHSA